MPQRVGEDPSWGHDTGPSYPIQQALPAVHDPVARPDPYFRPYALAPGWPITIEVHCAEGGVALVHGTVDRVPFLAGETAQRVVIRDAVARPLRADPRAA